MIFEDLKTMIPFDVLDANIVRLVRVLNSIPWVVTLESCGGHLDPEPGQAPLGEWMVVLRFERSEGGWAALSFLTYLQGMAPDVWLLPQFFAKESYQGLAFVLAGTGDPDGFAETLAERIPSLSRGAP